MFSLLTPPGLSQPRLSDIFFSPVSFSLGAFACGSLASPPGLILLITEEPPNWPPMSVEDPGEDLPVGPMWWSAVRGASLPGKKKNEKKIAGRSFPAEGDPRV